MEDVLGLAALILMGSLFFGFVGGKPLIFYIIEYLTTMDERKEK